MPTAAPRTAPSTMTITSYDTQTGYRVRKRLSRREMIMAGVVAFFVVLSIGLLVGLLVRVYVVSKTTSDICDSPECVREAAALLQSLDMSYSPCEDFYSFACEGSIRKMPVGREELTSQTAQNRNQLKEFLEIANSHNVTSAVAKAISMYQQCQKSTNFQNEMLEDIKELLAQLGGWPLAMKKEDWKQKNEDDFITFLAEVMRRGFNTELLDVTLTPDLFNSSFIRITLDQPNSAAHHLTNTLPRSKRQAGSPALLTDDDREEYRADVAKMAKLLGNNDTNSVYTDANDMFQLKKDIMESAVPSERRTNYTIMYKAMSLWELHRFTNSITTKFNWKGMLEKLFNGITVVSEDTDILMLLDMEYLRKFPEIFKKNSQRALTNYVIYEGILKPIMQLFNSQENIPLEGNSWLECLLVINDVLPHALTRLFVENQGFDINKTLDEAEDVVNNIQNAYKETIEGSKVLDVETNEGALHKLDGLKKFVGFPRWILDDLKLNDYYEYVEISSSLMKTYLTVKNKATLKELEEYRKPTHENRWPIDAVATHTQYGPIENAIWLPVGLLKPPHFDRNYLAAMNYGGVGSLIGREIGRGFDDTGRQFDENSTLKKWWSDYSQRAYFNQTHCFVWQYSHYCPSSLQTNNNSNESVPCVEAVNNLAENIADNTGVQVSFKAYKNWIDNHDAEARLPGLKDYSPEQLFFISFAQMWCENYPNDPTKKVGSEETHFPGRQRVNAALSNFPEFANAFHCSSGPMNREDNRCTLW